MGGCQNPGGQIITGASKGPAAYSNDDEEDEDVAEDEDGDDNDDEDDKGDNDDNDNNANFAKWTLKNCKIANGCLEIISSSC